MLPTSEWGCHTSSTPILDCSNVIESRDSRGPVDEGLGLRFGLARPWRAFENLQFPWAVHRHTHTKPEIASF